jgi:hypothetical protein
MSLTQPDQPVRSVPVDPDSLPLHEDPTWRLIRLLGYAGLLPFVFLAMCLWLVGPDLHPYIALAMQGYGAVIVSFLGGIHWGAGFPQSLTTRRAPGLPFIWGVMPSLLAWVGLMMPAFAGLPWLGFVLIVCYALDRRTWPAVGLAPWLPMRLQLTTVASLSCFFAAGAT